MTDTIWLAKALENHQLWYSTRDNEKVEGERFILTKDANLRGANLSNANLRGASLWGTTGNRCQVISLQTSKYLINYTKDSLQIGCKNYPVLDWFSFDDDTISAMDDGALDWWLKHRDFIKLAIQLNPAQ